MPPEIRRAKTHADFTHLAGLFRDYAAALGVDLGFQRFDDEIADVAGAYELALLAGPPSAPVGCVALKRLGPERCEMKRLYVKPSARRSGGAGRALAVSIIDEARGRGYREMVLDSLERLKPALALYESLGFERCAPYYPNPLPGAVYMRLAL